MQDNFTASCIPSYCKNTSMVTEMFHLDFTETQVDFDQLPCLELEDRMDFFLSQG